MKVYVYKSTSKNRIKFYANYVTEEYCVGFVCLGTIDLPIEPPKKTVVKEIPLRAGSGFYDTAFGEIRITPAHAKNVKITYEVEE